MNCPAQSDKDCWYQHPERRRLEAEVRDLKARIRQARRHGLTVGQLEEAREAMRNYIYRGVVGGHYSTYKAVQAFFRALDLCDLRRPLKRRAKR